MKKKDFDRFVADLLDKKLTVKRKQHILEIITNEVNTIWRQIIIPTFGAKLDWWSFSNDESAYNNDGNGSDGGEFDPAEYKEWISIIGEWTGDLGPFESGFPTEFLYSTDTYDKIIDEYEKDKVKKLKKAKKYRKKTSVKKKVLGELSKLPLDTLEKMLVSARKGK